MPASRHASRPLAAACLAVITCLVALVGCNLFEKGGGVALPGGPGESALSEVPAAGSSMAPGLANSVSFRIVLPGAADDTTAGTRVSLAQPAQPAQAGQPPQPVARAGAPLPSILATVATQPTVTFKLVLVNIGDPAQPTATLTKTVPVTASGTAEAYFNGVPAVTCVGDIHIEGGRIGSFTDFHGAADLFPNQEAVIELAPKGLNQPQDLLARVITRLVVSPDLFAKAGWGLAAKVQTALAGLDLGASDVIDLALALARFGGLVDALPAAPEGKTAVLVQASQAVELASCRLVTASTNGPCRGVAARSRSSEAKRPR